MGLRMREPNGRPRRSRRSDPEIVRPAEYVQTMTEGAEVARLVKLVRSSQWLMAVLRAAQRCALPDWVIGAGVLRDLVWDTMHGGFHPTRVDDVDVAFFDPRDLSPERDRQATERLGATLTGITWEATNQAAVHRWYEQWAGTAVDPLVSVEDGIATWPETATSVAVRLRDDDSLGVIAPLGLTDLLNGVCRLNPRRVTADTFRRRVQRKQVAERWPNVRIVEP